MAQPTQGKVTVEGAGKWLMLKPFAGSSREDLQSFLNDFLLCLESNGYVEVAQPNDTVDAESRAKLELMARVILCKSLKCSLNAAVLDRSPTPR